MTFRDTSHRHVRKADGPRPGEPAGRQSNRLTAREQQIVQAFIDAANILSGNIDYTTIARVVAQGIQALTPNLGMGDFIAAFDPAVTAITSEQIASGVAHVPTLPQSIVGAMRFDVTDPRALAWAQARGAELVRNITDEQRQVLANAIRNGIEQGKTVDRIADEVQNIVGLHQRWADAVTNTQQRELQRMLDAGFPQTQAHASAMQIGSAYRQKLLQARARNIARTEILTASNQGRKLSWIQAADQGLINPKTSKKRWLTGSLSALPGRKQVCDICAPLNGTEVPWDQEFPGVGVDMPPAHPSCRCTAVLVPEAGEKPKQEQATQQAADAQGWEEGGTFAGSRCDICPGNCKLRKNLGKALYVVNCPGLPSIAPSTAIPVTKLSEVTNGDTLFVSGQKQGYKVIGVSDGKISVVVPSGKGAITFDANKKYAVVPGAPKAQAAALKWGNAQTPVFTNTIPHLPPYGNASPYKKITKAADVHPGDTLYFANDKAKLGWTVLGPDASGKVGVLHPTTGKKYLLDLDKSAPKSTYAILPGPNKGWHLLNMNNPATAGGVAVQTVTGANGYVAKVGTITGHAKYPGNSYTVVKVQGNTATIKTMAGTEFTAPANELIGLPTGVQVKVGNKSWTVKHSYVDDLGETKIVLPNGEVFSAKDVKPFTATPGQGAAKPMSAQPLKPGIQKPSNPVPEAHAKTGITPLDDKAAVAKYTRDHKTWRNSLTRDQQAAVSSYTGSGYRGYNTTLRNNGLPKPGRHTKTTKLLEDALFENTLKEDVMLMRGVEDRYGLFAKSKVGTIFHDHGFQSTSVGTRAAFNQNVTLRIHAPAGTKGGYLGNLSNFNNQERELLLIPGATYRIDAIYELSLDRKVIDVTLISQGPPPKAITVDFFAKRRGLGLAYA